jgi:hypothetical protein
MNRTIATFVAAFAAGAAVSGVTASAIAVYWFRDVDPKYRDTPSLAFELDLWGVLAITLIGAVVVAIAIYLLRKRLSLNAKTVLRCALFGIAYPLLWHLLAKALEAMVGIESLVLPVVGWLYFVLFPGVCVFSMAAPSAAHKTHAA